MTEIIVAKHRNGPTAKIRLAFLDRLTRFSNYRTTEPSSNMSAP